jgi:oligosaccharide amylase
MLETMAIYQPAAIIGNSRLLAGVGEKGELMSLYYPHIDFPQNLRQGMPAVYFGAPGKGRLVWTFDPAWSGQPAYRGRSNVLETRLLHSRPSLALEITDLAHPGEDLVARRFSLSNPGREEVTFILYQYLDLQLGEVQEKNAIHYYPQAGAAAQYWRNMCFALGGDAAGQFGCGKAGEGSHNSAKLGMAAGRLNQQPEEIGDVDCAFGWELSLAPGETATRLFLIAAASNEESAMRRLEAARSLGFGDLEALTERHWEEYTRRARTVEVPPELAETYYRCLLGLRLLFDDDYGSILAAPEFDPYFEASGGYGYCWPRDAVEVMLALDAAGFPEVGDRFLRWAGRVQHEEGYWEQRYWLSGERGPVWSTREAGLQIDQTAAVVFAVGQHVGTLAPQQQPAFLEAHWQAVRRAASYLCGSLDPDTGLHRLAYDPWETFRGTFAYSNAAIYSALRSAAALALLAGDEAAAADWHQRAESLKQALLARLWLGTHFARGLSPEGELDPTVDASTLGLVDPFHLLSPARPEEREMIEKMLQTIIARLSLPSHGGTALRRFEGDAYLGGLPGAVTTLWLSRALLHLALYFQDKDRARALALRDQAIAYLQVVRRAATPAGLLPEMIGAGGGVAWAAPHGWGMASFVANLLLLDELEASLRSH